MCQLLESKILAEADQIISGASSGTLGLEQAQRIADAASLASAVRTITEERNRQSAGVNWRFATKDARIKLKRLYPLIEEK